MILILKFLLWLEIRAQEKCYRQMKADGNIEVSGICHGLAGGTAATEYLSDECCGCEYFRML